MNRKLSLLYFTLLLFLTSYSQTFNFNKLSINDGMAHPYIYDICQDKSGFIWVATGEGLNRLDGSEVKKYASKSGLADNFITCLETSNNGILWIGHNNGNISYLYKGNIGKINIDEKDIPVLKIKSYNVKNTWVLLQNNKLINIDNDFNFTKYNLFKNDEIVCTDFEIVNNNTFLVTTNTGIYEVKIDKEAKKVQSNKLPSKKHATDNLNCILKSKLDSSVYTVGTADRGVIQVKYANNKILTRNYQDSSLLQTSSVQDIFEDAKNNLWISTYSGLFKIPYSDIKVPDSKENNTFYNEENGLPTNYIKTSFVDLEGNLWVGTFGEGVCIHEDDFFTFYSHSATDISNSTTSFLITENKKWFGVANGLIEIDLRTNEKYFFYNSANGFVDDEVTTIASFDNNLLVGTAKSGLYEFDTEKRQFYKLDIAKGYLRNSITSLVVNQDKIWIGTRGALFEYSKFTKEIKEYTTLEGLKHNSINDLVFSNKYGLLIVSQSNYISCIKDGILFHLLISENFGLLNVNSIREDENNNIWVSTYGTGVFYGQPKNFKHINSANGLASDYCYAIQPMGEFGTWVGHRGSASRISLKNNNITIYSKKEGITGDCNTDAFYKDSLGNLWIGMNNGCLKFDPKKDNSNFDAPKPVIKTIKIGDDEYNLYDDIELSPGDYKLSFEYVGITFKNQKNISYKVFLDGYDLEWSKFTLDNKATYPKLSEGKYTFKIKACNIVGVCSEEVSSVQIVILPPIWKRWWFIALTVLIVASSIYAFFYIREKNHKSIVNYLDTELAKRTKEIVIQKEEIEQKNRDITDSINYAKRIQSAILPNISDLTSEFKKSYIFYQPKDIVSGDFFWIHKLKDSFILACADCTGHGVPGALMAMIGQSIFKEIINRSPDLNPAQLLDEVNFELNKILKTEQNEKMFEGMDVAVLKFYPKENKMEFSSAMRPLLILKNKEIIPIEGTKQSIGGNLGKTKQFELKEVSYQNGDKFYVFSDGYQDQFGGVNGKKIKISGIKKLILDNIGKNNHDEFKNVMAYFYEWQKDEDQIDDVLFIKIEP